MSLLGKLFGKRTLAEERANAEALHARGEYGLAKLAFERALGLARAEPEGVRHLTSQRSLVSLRSASSFSSALPPEADAAGATEKRSRMSSRISSISWSRMYALSRSIIRPSSPNRLARS